MPRRFHVLLAFLAILLASLASLVFTGALSAPAHAAGSCSKPSAAGLHIIVLTDQGQSRPFALYVPPTYDGHRRLPVILNLHGSGMNGLEQMIFSRLGPVASANGFAVAAPNGAVKQKAGTYAWNVPGVPLLSGQPVPAGTPNDETYLLRVVAKISNVLCVDRQRIFLTGFSGGGRMVSQLACDHSARFAAIAPVASLRAGVAQQRNGRWEPRASTCKPRHRLPILTFHGTADTVNPFAGNNDPRWGYSVTDALKRWARLDGCGSKARSTPVTSTATKVSFVNCKGGSSVTLYRSTGAGHSWPGGAPSPVGATDNSINASKLIVRFFKKIG